MGTANAVRWLGAMMVAALLAGCPAADQGEEKRMKAGFFKQGPEAELEVAIRSDDPAGIGRAIAAGAQVNARGLHNVTPLMIAVDRLKPKAVAELLARGANPNLKAADGASAVSLAVENYRHAPELMFAVLRGGGDPNMRRPDGDPVIMRFVNDRNCEHIRRMKELGADLDLLSRSEDPIIIEAAVGQDWDVVWCLIELGARYDYELTSRAPITQSLKGDFPAPDSPIYPYKKKVWQFLKDHGIAVPPLNE